MRPAWAACLITAERPGGCISPGRREAAQGRVTIYFIGEVDLQARVVSLRFWLLWLLAFLGFPLAGVLARLLGPITTVPIALLAGAVGGAALGLVQWLVLRQQLAISLTWVAATAVGLGLGLALSTLLLGVDTGGAELVWRGLLTGLIVGAAQMLLLRNLLAPLPALAWVIVVGLGWALGWLVMRSIGVDLSYNWAVFGSSGAVVFQLLTGLALFFLLRAERVTR